MAAGELNQDWASIPAMVRWAADEYGDAEALVGDGDDRLSFRELSDRVDRVARSIIGLGFQPGDVASIWAPNMPQWPIAALAVLACGGRLVPINTRYKGREAQDLLARSRATLLFTLTDFLDTDYVAMLRDAAGGPGADRAVADLEHLRNVVVLSGPTPEGCTSHDDFIAAGEDVPSSAVDERVAAIGPDDVSDIMFTSGTTGRSKGVVSTHGQSLRVFESWSGIVGLRPGDRYLIVNPFFHTFGYKAGFVSAIMRGATIVPHAVFDPTTVLERISQERISMLPGPPALYQGLINHPDLGEHDISSLRLGVTGAATIPVSLIEQMESVLGFDTVVTAYGLTEATGVVSICRDGDDPKTVATTSGCAIPDVELRIVDTETGATQPPGEPGEIVVRGYNVMQGYFEDPERTAEAIDGDGWLHTGDIGVLDERGYLDITDRLKDMFIVGGFNAYPAEIENELVEHPAISQAAVIGMPDDRLGEVGCAFVVPVAGQLPDEGEVIAWARDRMANFKVPRRVVVVDAFPTNASGKVLKHELRDQVATSAPGSST